MENENKDENNIGKLTLLLHEGKSHVVGLHGNIFVLDYTAVFNVSYW